MPTTASAIGRASRTPTASPPATNTTGWTAWSLWCRTFSPARRDKQIDLRTEYGYDPVGNLLTISDARGNTRSFSYDLLDRLEGTTDPLGNGTAYGYDAVGNLVARTDAEDSPRPCRTTPPTG